MLRGTLRPRSAPRSGAHRQPEDCPPPRASGAAHHDHARSRKAAPRLRSSEPASGLWQAEAGPGWIGRRTAPRAPVRSRRRATGARRHRVVRKRSINTKSCERGQTGGGSAPRRRGIRPHIAVPTADSGTHCDGATTARNDMDHGCAIKKTTTRESVRGPAFAGLTRTGDCRGSARPETPTQIARIRDPGGTGRRGRGPGWAWPHWARTAAARCRSSRRSARQSSARRAMADAR